ncbi:unnamed protein product [Linum trigynum]|uniref:Uncharacterized protein n=1 Tax=Linum trigynum TaxID=586398 RepID=A0AAV2ERB3_9ROSI
MDGQPTQVTFNSKVQNGWTAGEGTMPWVEALALATETTGFDGDWLRRKQSNDQRANDDETSDKETTGFDSDDCLRRKQSNDQRPTANKRRWKQSQR